MAADILIVDDEEDIRELVAGILEDEGHGARLARNSDEALAAIEARRPQLILLDIWLQGSKLDGLQLLEMIKKQNRQRAGGDDFRPRQHRDGGDGDQARRLRLHRKAVQGRPADPGRRARAGDLAAEAGSQRPESARRRGRPRWSARRRRSPTCRRIIEKLGPANSRVLISGGAGSGKELAARLIHDQSSRARRALRRHQCAGDVAGGHGSELFGVEASAGSVRAGSARSKRRTAARSISTKSPTCRARRRRRYCACWSTRISSGSAAPRAFTSTCASSPRPAAISPRRSPKGGFARICFTGCRWCRSGCPRSPSGATTFPNWCSISSR